MPRLDIKTMVQELGDVSDAAQALSKIVDKVIRKLVLFNLQNQQEEKERSEDEKETE
jgi:hypothetical protein